MTTSGLTRECWWVPHWLLVIARSGATKQSQGGGEQAEEREIAAPSSCGVRRMARNDRVWSVQRGKAPLPGVWGCPPVPYSSPKSGGQGVETRSQRRRRWAQPTLCEGDGGFHGHDEAWPSEDRRGFLLPQESAGTRPCRGFGGVPQFFFSLSPKNGGQGVDSVGRPDTHSGEEVTI